MAEHICDNICKHPAAIKNKVISQDTLDVICSECKVGKFLSDIINVGNEVDQLYLEKCEEVNRLNEKQIPKKPDNKFRHRGGYSLIHRPKCDSDYEVDRRYRITDQYCTTCGKLLDSGFRSYCANCGQAIDWKNEE